MSLNDINDLFEAASPKHYREFRKLYNELLGYFERNEFDKIKEFNQRIDYMITKSYYAQRALYKRLKDFEKQQDIVLKTTLHNRYRQPKKTIPISHLFPLKTPVPDSKKPESVSAINLDSAPVESQDTKVAELMKDMAYYDKKQAEFNQQVDDFSVDTTMVDSQVNDAIQGAIGHTHLDSIEEPELLDEDGLSLKKNLKDESLYFRKKNTDNDIDRAKKDSVQDDPADLPNISDNQTHSDASTDVSNTRKQRIWDYIEKDKQKGGIDHDL